MERLFLNFVTRTGAAGSSASQRATVKRSDFSSQAMKLSINSRDATHRCGMCCSLIDRCVRYAVCGFRRLEFDGWARWGRLAGSSAIHSDVFSFNAINLENQFDNLMIFLD